MTLTDVANRLGVCSKTVLRWEKKGMIKKAPRDWKGWRFYTPEHYQEIASQLSAQNDFEAGAGI